MKRYFALLLVLAMMFSLAACSAAPANAGEPVPEQNTPAAQATPQGSETLTAVTLSGSAPGRNADVTVDVTLLGDAIEEVAVTAHEESPGITDPAFARIPSDIVAAQSVAVDVVAGCTITSNAILEAVKAALVSGGIDPASYSKTSETATTKGALQEKQADVIIVGGGGSGLAAAVSALESGASVIVIDKMSALGGNTAVADGLYNAVDPLRQGAMGIEDSIEQFYNDTYTGGDSLAKPELVKILTDNAMTTLEWLETMGLELDSAIIAGTGALWPRGHYGVNHTGNDYITVLKNKAQEKGMEVYTETRGVELLVEGGRVTGVKAEGNENDYIFNANNGVILCTGGFGYNVEMRQEYNTQWPDLGPKVKCSNVPSATGDGIVMAQGIGANLVGMEYIQFYPVGDTKTGALGDSLPGSTSNHITVNKEGLRFMAEDARRDVQAKAIFDQTDGVCYAIIDADTADLPEEIAQLQKFIEKGEVFTGKTPEELAAQIGVDPAVLKNTFDTYNTSVDAGEDKAFGRVLLKEKMEHGPFYAALRAPTIHHTMGGIEINDNAQVLDTNGNVISGLYAAGENTGGVHGSNRLGGNALADCMVFGKIAGMQAAENK